MDERKITMGAHSYNVPNDIDTQGVQLTIGKFCGIATGLRINATHHCIIEHPEAVSQYPFPECMGLWDYYLSNSPGHVEIGNDVWIAGYVSILDGLTIGDGAILGANTVVTKDVPPYAFVAGNPATIKKYRFSQDIVAELLTIKWWDWTDEEIAQRILDFKDINLFIAKYG